MAKAKPKAKPWSTIGVVCLAVAAAVGLYFLGGYMQRANEAIKLQEQTQESTTSTTPGTNTSTGPGTTYQPPAPVPTTPALVRLTIPVGTVVPVRLDQSLNSATNNVGDTVTATVRSTQNGDAEFPLGSKVVGTITQVQRKGPGQPGMLDLSFNQVRLPDGRVASFQGSLISLDETAVSKLENGRLVAKGNVSGSERLKFIAIGAGVGVIIGKIADKNLWVSGGLGALAGLIYSEIIKNKRAAEDVKVASGTEFGVKMDQEMAYYASQSFANARNI